MKFTAKDFGYVEQSDFEGVQKQKVLVASEIQKWKGKYDRVNKVIEAGMIHDEWLDVWNEIRDVLKAKHAFWRECMIKLQAEPEEDKTGE